MKIDIIQFIKKLNLSLRLAACDSLFAVAALKSFRLPAQLASLFRKPADSTPVEKLAAFLLAENNPYLNALADEITARSDLLPAGFILPPASVEQKFVGATVVKTTDNLSDGSFYHQLAAEVVRQDLPCLRSHLPALYRRFDLLEDMRFYAAELETLSENTNTFPFALPVVIDWTKTDKPCLCLDFEQEVTCGGSLTPAAQENLLRLFTGLFYEKSLFVSTFTGVITDENARVNIIDFDSLYPADSAARSFLAGHLDAGRLPQSLAEFKLARVIRLLQAFCPQVNVVDFLRTESSRYPLQVPLPQLSSPPVMQIYARQGLILSPESKLSDPAPAQLAYLLDKNRFKKDPIFKKSSAYYYLPLLVVIYVLLKYF